jgi:hypothetical protein
MCLLSHACQVPPSSNQRKGMGTRWLKRALSEQLFSEPRTERGEKAREGAVGLEHILRAELEHLAKSLPAKSISTVQGQTELPQVWRPQRNTSS